jgi:predicted MFS family arabinose efflux permease
MYGLFSSIYCFSNVSAGVITTFGLGFFDAWTYFWIITALGLIACLYCLFFVPHLPNPAEKGHHETLLYEGNKNLSIQQVSSGE